MHPPSTPLVQHLGPWARHLVRLLALLALVFVSSQVLWRALGGRPRRHWLRPGHWVRLQRMGAATPDPQAQVPALVAALGPRPRGRLQVARIHDGQQVQLLVGHRDPGVLARLAHALEAQAEPADPPRLHLPWVAGLRCPWWQGGTRNLNPTGAVALADELGRLLAQDGQPAAVVARIGPLWPWRQNRYQRWLRTWLGGQHIGERVQSPVSHPHLATNVLYRGALAAGATDPQRLEPLLGQCVEALPGFDFMWRARQLRWGPLVLGAAVAGAAAAWSGWGVPGVLWAALLVAAGAGAGAARWLGYDLADPTRRQLQRGLCPPRATLGWWPQRAFYGRVRSRPVPNIPGLPLSPLQVLALLQAPQRAAAGGLGQRALQQPAPAQVRQRVPDAPLAGLDCSGRPVWLDPGGREEGLLVLGDPGQGKTVACLGIWGADLAWRRLGPPDQRCMLWLETKGDGAARALAQARRAGYADHEVVVLDCGSSTGPRLELLDRGNPSRAANEITEALTYALPAGSIMGASAQALVAAFQLALHADAATWEAFGGKPPSVLKLVLGLMGGLPGEAQSALWEFFRSLGQRPTPAGGPRDPALYEVLGELDPLQQAVQRWGYYMAMPPRERDQLLRPPINKIADLSAAAAVWTPDPARPDVSISDLLQQRRVAIINFGGGGLSPQVAQRLSAMFLYLLRAAIERCCGDWQRQGYSVTVFSDELSHLCDTQSGEDILSWFKDAGRSFGVRLVLGTQRMDQLPAPLIRTLSTLGTKIYLRTESPQMAQLGAQDLGPPFAEGDLRALSRFEGAVRTRWAGVPQPPFNLYLIPEDQFDPQLVCGTGPPRAPQLETRARVSTTR